MFNRKFVIVLVVVILVPLVLLFLRFGVGGWTTQSLMVSPQTTVIEGPLGANGYPDYIAALNEHLSEGVTPENNAAVLLLRAMGPREISPAIQAEFFKRIGATPVAEAKYFIDWPEYCKAIPAEEQANIVPTTAEDRFQALADMQEEAISQPWSRDDFPHLGKWLDANQEAIETIVAASRLPRYYAPLISEQDPPTLVSVLLPLTQQSRAAAHALMIRAMLRLHEKQYQAAWDDFVACRRLGRVMGQGGLLVDALVGYAIEGLALEGQEQFIAEAKLSPDEWAALQKDFDAVPPRNGLSDKFDRGERFMFLDLIVTVAQQGPNALDGVMPGSTDNLLTAIALHGVNWNVPLATLNEWMDRFVAAAKIEDPKQRAAATDQIEADIRALQVDFKEPWSIAAAIFSRSRASEKVGDLFVALVCPAISSVFQSEARLRTNDDLVYVGLALARFKADKGHFPEKLDELSPHYLKAVPTDAFASTPFVYKKHDDGYLLYSFGANQKDDAGQGYDQQADDLAIEIPRPPKKQPAEEQAVDPVDDETTPPGDKP